jgi:F-type H+-transporting ATPase subunit delta
MQGNSNVGASFLNPYAEAMMSVAQSQNLLDIFDENCKAILQSLTDSPDFEEFLGSPIVQVADKKAVVQKVLGSDVNPVMMNVIMVLIDRGRVSFLGGICTQYQVLLRKLKGNELAEVTTAVELTDAQKAAIVDRVKAMTGANNVDIAVKIDPAIIGGAIVKVGSQIIDSSLRSQLRLIGMSLAK